jgi:hypothetical protein
MYSLIRSITLKELFIEQTISLGISFIIAELFYKFHSFTLECLAFLATWYVIDAIIQLSKNVFITKTSEVNR